jgi:spoIIIJ-associated protein
MPIDDLAEAAQTIGNFLQAFTSSGGLRLRFRVKVRGAASPEPGNGDATGEPSSTGQESPRTLYVEFSGPDTHALTAHNGEVLNALEHLAVKILRLEPDEQERVSFDADHFKANRDRQMRESAALAVERVRATGRPHPFPAMNSRERRMLHMILSESGLPTASSGEGPGRFVVLYPAGADVSQQSFTQSARRADDSGRVRQAFRHR